MADFPLRQWKQDVLEAAGDRFERRLSEELGTFRTEVARDLAGVRVDMANMHSSLVRWMFIFWMGQLGVTLTIVGVILRAVRLL